MKNHDFKLYVNDTGGERDGLWHCQRCKESGNPISFVMKYNKIAYRDAIDILELYDYEQVPFESVKRETGLSTEDVLYMMLMDNNKEDKEEPEVKKVPNLPPNFKPIMANLHNPEVLPFLQYLQSRGVTSQDILLHHISYITQGMIETLRGSKINLANHLVFFTFDTEGNYQYWNTRSIVPQVKVKSINAITTEDTYGKSDVIFNLNNALHTDKIVITEGVFDAMTIGKSGVSIFGKQISKNQFNLLKRSASKEFPIYIFLDKDAKDQTNRAVELLNTHFNNVYIVMNQSDADPNDLGKEKVQELIEQAQPASPETQLLFNLES